jgi:hypothetical protein
MRFLQRSTPDSLLTLTKTDALVQKFRDLNVWRHGDERAPHKPFLALYALAQVQSGAERLIPFDHGTATFWRPEGLNSPEATVAESRLGGLLPDRA